MKTLQNKSQDRYSKPVNVHYIFGFEQFFKVRGVKNSPSKNT